MMEYVIGVLLAVAAVVAMTVYVQRGIQARVRDSRNKMIVEVTQAANPRESEANFPVRIEYEPYYGNVVSDVDSETRKVENFGGKGLDRAYQRKFLFNTITSSRSQQLPPADKELTE